MAFDGLMIRGSRKLSVILPVLALVIALGDVHGDEILSQEHVSTGGGFSTGDGQSFFLPGKTSITAVEVLIGPESELVQANIWETERVNRHLVRKSLEGFPRTHGVINNHEIAGDSPRWVRIELVREYKNSGTAAVELVLDFTLTTDGEDTVSQISNSVQDPYEHGSHVRWASWMNEYLLLQSVRDLTFRIIGEGFPVKPEGWFGQRTLLVPGDDGCYAIYFEDFLTTSDNLIDWWYPFPQPKSPLIIEPAKNPLVLRKFYRSDPQ